MLEKGNCEFLASIDNFSRISIDNFSRSIAKRHKCFIYKTWSLFHFYHIKILFVFAIFVRDVVPSMFLVILEKSVGLLKKHRTRDTRVTSFCTRYPLPFGSADNESRRSLHLTVVCSLLFPIRVLLLVFAVIYAGERPNSGFE